MKLNHEVLLYMQICPACFQLLGFLLVRKSTQNDNISRYNFTVKIYLLKLLVE